MYIDYRNLQFLDQVLRLVLYDVETEFGPKRITSLYRINDPGVHGTLPVRGVDLGEHNQLIGNIIKGWVNSRWIYDPERITLKVCVFGDENHLDHIHLQTHKNTQRR